MLSKFFRSRVFQATFLALAVISIVLFMIIVKWGPGQTVFEHGLSVSQGSGVEVSSSGTITSSRFTAPIDSSPAVESTSDLIATDATPVSSASPITSGGPQVLLLVLSFLALVVSLWLNVFLLKWRRSVTADHVSIVPSELLETFAKQTKALNASARQHDKNFDDLTRELSAYFRRTIQEAGETKAASGEVITAFTGLQRTLNEKDAEIERLRGGYDSEVFRRFLSRFMRLEKVIAEEVADLDPADSTTLVTLTDIQTLLKDALSECGLESFTPERGVSIRDAIGVEITKQRPAEHTEQVLTIAEVIEPGWRMRTPEGFDHLKEAQVVVYVDATELKEKT